MSNLLSILVIVAVCAFPFLMMPLMWRRMKRVQTQLNREAKAEPTAQPWQEPIESRDGLILTRDSSPNEELIALGAKARQSRWPLDNG